MTKFSICENCGLMSCELRILDSAMVTRVLMILVMRLAKDWKPESSDSVDVSVGVF